MLISRIKKTIAKYSLLQAGDRVLVAVSGGPDSVCLLSALQALAGDFQLTLHVAHLDHMFRGRESADEARFVADLAKRLGIPATVEQFDVPSLCRERGLSPQAGAREARYAFLRRTAGATRSTRIATGHTADDQAETLLMRFMRGAGMSGLSSIPPSRENIIRPLIEITRNEVLRYLKERKLEFVTDPSNKKRVYTRNRIRLDILPALKNFNPRIVETLASEAALLREEDEAVEAHLETVLPRVISWNGDAFSVNRDEFNALPRAFKRRLLRKTASLTGVDPSLLSFDVLDEALSFMTSAQTGRTMALLPGLTVGREYDRLVISAPQGARGFSQVLTVPGATEIPGAGLTVVTSVIDGPDDPENSQHLALPGSGQEAFPKNYFWQALFDYDKIAPLLTLRSRRSGDRFHPSGMNGGSKKIQDYFVDEKIPRRKRDAVPLLCSGEDILWVVGMRTDERFRPDGNTKRILAVRICRVVESLSRYVVE